MLLGIAESVSAGAQPDDGPARIDVIEYHLQLVIRQGTETQKEYCKVRSIEDFKALDVLLVLRIPLTGTRINRINHGALEQVPPLQNPGKHRHGYFRAILIVAGDEHNMRHLPYSASGRIRILGQGPCR